MEKIKIGRREFVKLSSMAGSLLALGFYYPASSKTTTIISKTQADELGVELNGYIFIEKSGQVSIASPRVEIGQGVFQSLPMLVAEELEVDISKIKIIQFGRDEKRFGRLQNVGGSNSIRSSWLPLRKLGASAREVLFEAAASRWKVIKSECHAEQGEIIHRSTGKKFHYGELVEEASKLSAPTDPVLKKPSEFKILGKPILRQDIPLKVTGQAQFGIDLKAEGMLYATVEHCPIINGKVKSFNAQKSLAIPGVRKVFATKTKVYRYMREGVAVLADTFWAAQQGRKVLEIEWDFTDRENFTEDSISQKFKEASVKEGKSLITSGNLAELENNKYHLLRSEYECPYQAHATMEPMNCIVSVKDNKCEFWGGTQGPGYFQRFLAETLGIPKENVTVNVPFTGGGLGRRGHEDFAHEAALIAKEAGVPIKLVWTREDDMLLSMFRPATLNVMRGAVDAQGHLIALQNKMIIQDLDLQEADANQADVADWIFDGAEQPYKISNLNRTVVPMLLPVPVGYWRSVYASTNSFSMECFIDELADAVGKDPLDFRKQLLIDQPRFIKVLEVAAEKSDWKRNWAARKGIGLALVNSFGSICCHVIKISKSKGVFKINKIISVFDCGLMVNPDTVKAQIEGNIIMGLGAALTHQIHFKNGEVVEKNFDTYKMPRLADVPPIEIHLIKNEEEPGGVGEPALPPVAPALANALFNLTGKRLRKLPIDLNQL